MKVVIVNYRLWPGMGIKAVVSSEEVAAKAIELLMKRRRQANQDCPYVLEGFELIHTDVDEVTIAGRRWAVGDRGYSEVKDEPAPALPEVPGGG